MKDTREKELPIDISANLTRRNKGDLIQHDIQVSIGIGRSQNMIEVSHEKRIYVLGDTKYRYLFALQRLEIDNLIKAKRVEKKLSCAPRSCKE